MEGEIRPCLSLLTCVSTVVCEEKFYCLLQFKKFMSSLVSVGCGLIKFIAEGLRIVWNIVPDTGQTLTCFLLWQLMYVGAGK